jgi:hypothetical protein
MRSSRKRANWHDDAIHFCLIFKRLFSETVPKLVSAVSAVSHQPFVLPEMVEVVQFALGLLTMTILCTASYLFWNWYSNREKTPDYTLSLDGSGGNEIDENEDKKNEALEKLFSKNENPNVLSGETDVYNWNQTDKEVELYVPVAASVKGKDINCKIRSNNMILTVSGEILINGDFYATVVPDECNWQIGSPNSPLPLSLPLSHCCQMEMVLNGEYGLVYLKRHQQQRINIGNA